MFKKALSLLLTAVLALGVLPVASLAAEGCDCGVDPVIFIDGLNGCDLIRDEGIPDQQRVAFPFDPARIGDIVVENRAAIWDMLDVRYSDENRDTVMNAVLSLFPDVEMTPDGESLYNITADWRPETRDIHRTGEYFPYRYDWRLDPYVNAAGLEAYIDHVLALTGHDKVDLLAVSLGGTVLNTYLTVYGTGRVDSCVWYCGAQTGVKIASDVFQGHIRFDAQEVTSFLHEATPDSVGYQVLSLLMQGLADIGATGSVLRVANKIMAAIAADGSFRDLMLRSFGRMPGVWACVDSEAYEKAKDFMFPTEADRAENAGLIEKIDRYHYEVQARSDAIMAQAQRETGKIAVIANYGYHLAPVVPDSDVMSDRLLDTAHSSCGGTFARYGDVLPAGGSVSPDRMADVSTAAFPAYTWIARGLYHGERPQAMRELFRFIFEADSQPDVNSDARYPQYLTYDRETGALTPQTEEAQKQPKLAARIRTFFLTLRRFLRGLFGK